MSIDLTTWPCGPPPSTGQKQQYPGRFEFNLRKTYSDYLDNALHMFSGAIDWGTTTDMRPETGADVVAPYESIPLPDNSFSAVLADPPYNKGFSNEWTTHAKDLPKPKRILKEAIRLVCPGGLVFILHVIVIPAYKIYPCDRIALHPVLAGPNNAIRVLNVFRKTVTVGND